MTLRFKRNLPLVLALVGILTVLALMIGNQPIVSYTINTEALRSVSFMSLRSNASSLGSLFSIVQP